MSKTYDFLKECGVFYFSTIYNDCPVTRPFGAVMEHNGFLYFSTANTKTVYSQIKINPNIQIVAMKAGTREWLRMSGKAEETTDMVIKQMMLDTCPILKKRFVVDSESYALFRIEEMKSTLMDDCGSQPIE